MFNQINKSLILLPEFEAHSEWTLVTDLMAAEGLWLNNSHDDHELSPAHRPPQKQSLPFLIFVSVRAPSPTGWANRLFSSYLLSEKVSSSFFPLSLTPSLPSQSTYQSIAC